MNFPSKQMFIGVAVGAVAGWLVFGLALRPAPRVEIAGALPSPSGPKDCVVKERGGYTVLGSSMGKLLPEGSKVKIAENYYACKEAEKNDIILYNYPGSQVPLAKRVVGAPGDKFDIKKDSSGGGWNILINGKVATNSEGQPYALDDRGYRMISLYVKDYKGVIPADAYLIMGETVSGSLDSSHFGLVGRDDFLGKVEK